MCSVIGGLSESIESQLSKQPPGKLGLIMRETTTSTVIWLTAPLGVSRYLLCMKFVVGRARTSIVRHFGFLYYVCLCPRVPCCFR